MKPLSLLSPFVFSLSLDRASFLRNLLLLTGKFSDHSIAENSWQIRLPVEHCSGGSYCVRLKVVGATKTYRIYRAAVDTGSPYLVLSGDRDIYEQRGNLPFSLVDSPIYRPTEEIYGAGSGFLQWKEAKVKFRSTPLLSSEATVLALMDDQLEVETGGTLLGLVKHPNPPRQQDFYRPTWLQQVQFRDGSSVRSFSIDPESLVLSSKSLLDERLPLIPLIDLRPLGDFIEHYCFVVKKLTLDGVTVTSHDLGGRPIVAVLDTGLTGCLVTQNLWDALADQIQIDPRRIRLATVSVQDITKRRQVDFTSGRGFNKLFYIAPISLDWFVQEERAPFLLVMGQTYLGQGKLTVDMEDRLASFQL